MLVGVGFVTERTAEEAWADFRRFGVNYETVAYRLADRLTVPPAPWSGHGVICDLAPLNPGAHPNAVPVVVSRSSMRGLRSSLSVGPASSDASRAVLTPLDRPPARPEPFVGRSGAGRSGGRAVGRSVRDKPRQDPILPFAYVWQTPCMQLTAAAGLGVDVGADGVVRIGLDGEDWLGPGRTSLPPAISGPNTASDRLGTAASVTVVDGDVRCSVRAYADRALLVFRCEAKTDLTDIATGAFDEPSVAWPTFSPIERAEHETPKGLRALVFQHCEFALPSNAGPSLDGWFLLPHRPPTGWPLLLTRADGRTILIAPLDAFHEQIIGLNGGTLRCGWHGDLESVAAGFTTRPGRPCGRRPRCGTRCLGQHAAGGRWNRTSRPLARRGRFTPVLLDRQRFGLLVQDGAGT